jgi:hypothetical protein
MDEQEEEEAEEGELETGAMMGKGAKTVED